MSGLLTLNNEMQTLMVVILFLACIFLTISTLCEMFSHHKLRLNLELANRILNIMLCVIWAFIFFNYKNTPCCEILAYFSFVNIVMELVLSLITKKTQSLINIPFYAFLLPLWKYAGHKAYTILIIISTIYLFMKSLVLLMNSLSKLKSNINYYSLKEALDGLDTAVMFENGYNVVYENSAMQKLLKALDINIKKNAGDIWKELELRNNSKLVDEQNVLVFLDDKIYSFSIVRCNKTQLYAFDITKEYLTTMEIENKQVELKVKQAEIIKMINELDEIEKQKEVLALKSKLHDIIGQRLFILHHILDVIDDKNFNLNNVKDMLLSMINEIDNDEVSEVQNIQKSIVTAFEMIGFNIDIIGQMPNDIKKARALIKIIRECATNAIRHANATKLFVKIDDDRIEIFDDGTFIEQKIIEGTGIKGMRLNSQELGGELLVNVKDKFKIIILLKN